ncbi:hypothetical protein AAVH_23045, partial [Aphelenchoides avenae]
MTDVTWKSTSLTLYWVLRNIDYKNDIEIGVFDVIVVHLQKSPLKAYVDVEVDL